MGLREVRVGAGALHRGAWHGYGGKVVVEPAEGLHIVVVSMRGWSAALRFLATGEGGFRRYLSRPADGKEARFLRHGRKSRCGELVMVRRARNNAERGVVMVLSWMCVPG